MGYAAVIVPRGPRVRSYATGTVGLRTRDRLPADGVCSCSNDLL